MRLQRQYAVPVQIVDRGADGRTVAWLAVLPEVRHQRAKDQAGDEDSIICGLPRQKHGHAETETAIVVAPFLDAGGRRAPRGRFGDAMNPDMQ